MPQPFEQPISSWKRTYFTAPAGRPFLFYVVYGAVDLTLELSASRHRCTMVPPALRVAQYGPDKHPDVVEQFREGYLWESLQRDDGALADRVATQTQCVILSGEFADSDTLDDFRNTIGLVTYLLDAGGVAVFDPQMFCWWSASAWRAKALAAALPTPNDHVQILVSESTEGEWFHTRGMRKFGRPDLSIHAVTPRYRDAIIEVCNRFIEYQALGGVIDEHRAIRMAGLPEGMTCSHRGSLDDPDFNNVHVEILWPDESRS